MPLQAALQAALQAVELSQKKTIFLTCNFKKKNIYILYKMDTTSIVNNAYHSAVLSGLVITNSVLSKKNTKYEIS